MPLIARLCVQDSNIRCPGDYVEWAVDIVTFRHLLPGSDFDCPQNINIISVQFLSLSSLNTSILTSQDERSCDIFSFGKHTL